MAARNRCFRIAALVAAMAYLLLAARDLIAAQHVFGESRVKGGYIISSVLFPVAHLIEAGGWVVVVTALGRKIDWRRLWLGGTIVATGLFVSYAAWVFYVIPTLADVQIGDFRSNVIWAAIGALLVAVGAAAFATGLSPSRRGRARSTRLWVGMFAVTAAFAADTVGLLYLQSFYADQHAAHAVTIGALVQAVGAFGLALAALVFALRVRSPLGDREAALTASAAGATVALLCQAGGEVMVAIYASSHGAPLWQAATYWLACSYRVGLAATMACVALGARRAAAAALPADALGAT